MPIQPKKWIALSIFLLMSLNAEADTETLLKDLRKRIAVIQLHLSTQEGKRSFYLKELKNAELEANHLAQKMKKTSQDLNQQKQILAKLKVNSAQYQAQLQSENITFTEQLKAAYLVSQQPYLKLLLSQDTPDNAARMLQYYRYLNQDRLEIIERLNNTLAKIQSNAQQTEMETQKLSHLQINQKDQQLKFSSVQKNRQEVLKSLDQEIQTKNQKLQELINNKKALEQTLNRLNRNPIAFIMRGKSFKALKGRLTWPTRGRIVQAYGTQIEESELHANGVLIAAPMNQNVYAVAPGKVIFSKWMTGYGLLLIIDHGNHYMSLYGRNHSLYKKVGEVVKGGELISAVGSSGGYQQPELYFALRLNAAPLNPSEWCTRQP